MHARTGSLKVIPFLLSAFVLSGCLGFITTPSSPPPTEGIAEALLAYTQAAETISAELTLNAPAPETATATPTEVEETLPPTSTPLPTNTPLPSDTPTPIESPTPPVTDTPTFTPEPAWQLLWSDDFTSGRFWSTERGDTFRLFYSAGGYSIASNVVDEIVFSVRTEALANVRLEVIAQWKEGPFDTYYGLICHFLNGGNYYLLAVGADGWYGILKKMNSRISALTEGMDASGVVYAGSAPNTLRADCVNGNLTLWVNGVPIATARDLSFTAGMVGLGVGARKKSGVQVIFDDFMVYTLAKR